jgi:hypothetical protein
MIKFKLSNGKLEFWETRLHYCELDSVLILKDFSGKIDGEIRECGFFGEVLGFECRTLCLLGKCSAT